MILDSLKPDNAIFYVIDGVIYVLLFSFLVSILRLSLRFLAKNQADESAGKSILASLLILLASGAVVAQPLAQQMGAFIVLPCLLLAAVILRLVCWVSFTKGLVIITVVGAVAFGANAGVTALADKVLPKERVTLSATIKKSMGLIDKFAGQSADPMISGNFFKGAKLSNLLVSAKGGLRLETESLVAAVVLLKDPDRLRELTSEHTEDLKALDLIVDGETLTVDDMAEMGIVAEEGKKGLMVLQGVNAGTEITQQDVEDVAIFIRSMRKDGSKVTASDALVVIREAQKKAVGRNLFQDIAKLTSHNTADLSCLGGVLDGAKLTPEQLTGMGVVSREAQDGIAVLESLRATNDFRTQDLGKVMSLLKSVRKDGSEVTTNDALVVIRETMKRAGLSPTNELFAMTSGGITNRAARAAPGAGKTAAKVVIHQDVQRLDPLLALGAEERAAWMTSQTGLVVTATMSFLKGNALAIVNGEMVHRSEVVSVTSQGRTFAWRLVGFRKGTVVWEPVLNDQIKNEAPVLRWQ